MADDPLDNNDPPTPRSPWASLSYRDYRLLFFVALFATTAQQMRLTQNLFQVYELSGSAFQLGLTGLAQAIPCLPWIIRGHWQTLLIVKSFSSSLWPATCSLPLPWGS
jgi:hypothetical protein